MNSKSRVIAHSKPTLLSDDFDAVNDVLASGMIASLSKVEDFESNFCDFVGGKFARSTSSGKDAMLLALFSLGLAPGDEVILPTYICRSVLDAVELMKLNPVIVDVSENYCIDPQIVQSRISSKTRAIVVAHIFGIPAPIDAIRKLTRSRNIFIIEDCAHAFGRKIGKKPLGSLGDVSIFSFHATKLLTTGEGGMLVINNNKVLRYFGSQVDSPSKFFSLSDLDAALGIAQLRKFNRFLQIREKLAMSYYSRLNDFGHVVLPDPKIDGRVFFRFTLRIQENFEFEDLRKRMEARGVHIRRGVDLMLHQVKKIKGYPQADALFEQTVSLPIYPSLTDQDVDYIVKVFREEAVKAIQ